jgi:very-short-patch-repair endonuclease
MNSFWNNVTKKDILKAIKLLDASKQTYPEPRNTFLIYNDKRYPAKHIRGLAYLLANKTEISKNEYSGGQETADFLRKFGFTVEYKKGTLRPKLMTITLPKVDRLKLLDEKNPIKRLSVVSQKNAIQMLLQKHYGHIETEKKFGWLKTPNHNNLPEEYKEIVTAISKYRNQNGFQKSNYFLSCDIVLNDKKLIIEYDENQHFSKARKISLENYPARIQLNYSKEKWIAACEKINAKDNNPIDRDEKRAYFDAVRDIEAFKHGYRLIRIKHGDIDWETTEAEIHLNNLLSEKRENNNVISGKHKIARLIVTGKEYDSFGNPNYERLAMLLESFILHFYGKLQFEFIVSPGGFLTFEFPENLHYKINLEYAEDNLISIFEKEANITIRDFFEKLPEDTFNKLKNIVDYFTVGIDGYNPINKQKIELVAVYDLKIESVIRWTGKFYPRPEEQNTLIKINDLRNHFIELNNQNVVILGCHDLNVYSPRGQAVARANGWRKQLSNKFKGICSEFKPDIILQHPHKTFSPKNWNLAWDSVREELPSVSHYASGINYQKMKASDTLRPLSKVLEKTKKGDVVDFIFDN